MRLQKQFVGAFMCVASFDKTVWKILLIEISVKKEIACARLCTLL